MISWLVLILMAVYFYHGYLSRRLDRRKLSHSSYYEGFCATGVIFRKTARLRRT